MLGTFYDTCGIVGEMGEVRLVEKMQSVVSASSPGSGYLASKP